MALKSALIVLACTLAVCNAEAPFRGYSSRAPQSAPYPAAGFRPERAFNLPSEEAIAQQLRLAQLIKQQRQQQQQQQRPSQLYGAPSESETQQPSGLYGAPAEEAPSQQQPQQVRPQRPSQQYGPPQEAAASQLRPQVVRPQQPSRQYVAPQQAAASQRQVQRQPSRQYGPPSEAPVTKPTPEGNSEEEETKEVETVAAVANAFDNKAGRLRAASEERDTENDEAETTRTTAAAAPAGLVLVPLAGYTPQKLAFFQAPAAATFAKLQLPTVFGLQQPKLLAPQLLAPQAYYQPQQFAYAAPLQAW